MTGREIRKARATLGRLWGLDRALRAAELGRALRLQGRDPGRSVLDWESGKTHITGPVSLAIEAMLAGYLRDGERLQIEVERLRKLERAFMDGSLKGV